MRILKSIALVVALSLGACAGHPGSGELLGTGLGGAAGGVIGNMFGGGNGKVASTILGTLVGGFLGNQAGASMDRANMQGQGPVAPIMFTPPPQGTGMMMHGTNYRGDRCQEFWQNVETRNGPSRVWGVMCQARDGSYYFPQDMN